MFDPTEPSTGRLRRRSVPRAADCSPGSDTSSTAGAAGCWPLAGAFLAFAVVWGTGVFGSLISSGFDTPGSESARALTRAEDTVGRDAADVVVLYRDGGRTVDDPRFRDAVADAISPTCPPTWSRAARPGGRREAPPTRSCRATGRRPMPSCTSSATDDDALMDAYDALEPRLREAPAGLTRPARR